MSAVASARRRIAPTILTGMYFVYILQSESTGRFYVGHTDHMIRRFNQHRNGDNQATRHRGPWFMPYFEILPTRAEAMHRERQIKAWKSASAINRLIHEIPA